jgi:hypothetical protein
MGAFFRGTNGKNGEMKFKTRWAMTLVPAATLRRIDISLAFVSLPDWTPSQ